MRITNVDTPVALTMWDFSWLERRYPGGGYDDWDAALDALTDRGYDAVRIDAYPHFIATDGEREWTLQPVLRYREPYQGPAFPWGSPGECTVQPTAGLREFVRKCADRDLHVGLTSWYRGADDYPETNIDTPADWGRMWVETLSVLEEAGLTDTICFVDLCNEFGTGHNLGFMGSSLIDNDSISRASEEGTRWMSESVATVRNAFPQFDYTISFSHEFETWEGQDVSFLDFLELHLWMDAPFSEFIDLLGNHRPWRFDYYDDLATKGEAIYRLNPEHWQARLQDAIDFGVEWSNAAGKPLVTTEAWAVHRAMDWPQLNWEWIKELDEYGVRHAIDSGRWVAVCTSNHCGPQFTGMWQDEDWHRQLTDDIHRGTIDM